MARIRPFQGYVIREAMAAQVVAPCADALSVEERQQLCRHNPDSFLRAIQRHEGLFEHSTERLMKDNFAQINRLIRDSRCYKHQLDPVLYLYQLKTQSHEQTGLVCCIKTHECIPPSVLVHELTDHEHENRLLEYMANVGAVSTPIAMTWKDHDAIGEYIRNCTRNAPEVCWQQDDLQQCIWCIDDAAQIDWLMRRFEEVSSLYLVDGHHRLSCAQRFRDEIIGAASSKHHEDNEILCVLFPAAQMRIFPYYHVIHQLSDEETAKLIRARPCLSIAKKRREDYDSQPDCGYVYLHGQFYQFQFEGLAHRDKQADSLWINRVYRDCLQPDLGVEEGSHRVSYRPGCVPLTQLIQELDSRSAVLIPPPVRTEQVCAVADQRGIMPPKSTWFDPKVRTGVFVRALSTFGKVATKL